MTHDTARPGQPVTVIVKRWPKPARRAEWEGTLADGIARLLTAEGHLGATILKPAGADECMLIVGFRSRAEYEAWRGSADTEHWSASLASMEMRAPEFVEAEAVETRPGLPAAAAAPARIAAPPRTKMALTTWLGVYPTITLLLWALWPAMGDLPMALRALVLTALMVPLLTWVVMPALMRLLRPWLFAGREPAG